MKKLNFLLTLLCVITLSSHLFGQTITGTITDSDGVPLIGATVQEEGTTNGAFTDNDGNFSLTVNSLPTVLLISYTGFTTQRIETSERVVDVVLQTGSFLDEVVVTGTRGKPRTILGSAVPIDNINASDLQASGQVTVASASAPA